MLDSDADLTVVSLTNGASSGLGRSKFISVILARVYDFEEHDFQTISLSAIQGQIDLIQNSRNMIATSMYKYKKYSMYYLV